MEHDDRLINAGQQRRGRCSEKFHETNPSEMTCRGEMPPRPTTIAKTLAARAEKNHHAAAGTGAIPA